MLRRLFGGRDGLAHADPRMRREAVLALDAVRATARADQLAKLLADDPDRTVRLAAIERIDAIEVLAKVLDDASVGDAAARRIGTLAAAGGSSLPDHPRLGTLNLLHAPAEQQEARIAAMDDPEQLIALALKDRGALRAAVLAHPALQSGTALGLLEKRSRGADKSLNRLAREALDAMKRAQHQAATAAARARELIGALGRVAAASDHAAWDREQHLYQQCVAALATYDEARTALARYGELLPALDELRARLVHPAPRAQPQVSSDTRTDTPQPPAAQGTATLAEGMAPVQEPIASPAATDPVDTGSTDTGLVDAAQVTPDTASPQVASGLQPVVGTAPEFDPEQVAAAAARRAAAAERHAAFEAIDQLLDATDAAITAGHVIAGRQQLAEARHRLDAIGGELPRRLANRLNRLGAALAELRDWQTFVTLPKREALCEALQALVQQPLAPQDQADRLKSLRGAWRELGPVTHGPEARLAERFNALAEQAFEPCRAYFAEQSEIRRTNLAERARICDQLAQYLTETDWPRADMKAAEQILRTARDAWRQYLPVDRGAGKAVESRFEALQDDLHNRLKAFWDDNADAKQRVVAEAEALATGSGDIEPRINQAKGLQQRWRSIGPAMPRAKDQALWNAFRVACDTLFAARENARIMAESELRELAGQCAAALDAFDAELTELTPATASAAQARLLRERLRAVENLPPPLRQPLLTRRNRLLDRHQALLQDHDRFTRAARLAELAAHDVAFSQAEVAQRDGAAAPVAPERCFTPRLGRHAEAVPYDALRRLTLRAEQAAGIAPAPEDESLRLEVQVERLRAGLGGADAEAPLELAERWCGMGPKDATVDPLRVRFFAALAARQDA